MVYVEFKYVLPFTFHRNMKIILSITYLMAITHALISSSMQVVQVAMTSAKPPCESFAPKWFYETVHMTLTTFTVGMVIMLFMLMCERAIATLLSKKYEVTGVTVGIFLSALGIRTFYSVVRRGAHMRVYERARVLALVSLAGSARPCRCPTPSARYGLENLPSKEETSKD
ncbi:hypothetical protein RB195_002684 [Necator americanus]|uniref:G-protein coupled receptors family 3 profile domain-containing protein n=1 Tax=Necator americanus TaxID=51031 RepID=A0ABR1DK71_NECAM